MPLLSQSSASARAMLPSFFENTNGWPTAVTVPMTGRCSLCMRHAVFAASVASASSTAAKYAFWLSRIVMYHSGGSIPFSPLVLYQ